MRSIRILAALFLSHGGFCETSAAQASTPAARTVALTFEINMTAEIDSKRFDPSRDRVGIRGAAEPLSWQKSIEARPNGDAGNPREALYAVTIAFEREALGDQPLQYKFKIERAGAAANDGWESGRNRVVLTREATLSIKRAFDSPPEPIPLERTGRIDRIAPDSWPASKFVEPREIQVWLPPGYEADALRRYPVLYLHDGNNVFDAAGVGAEWRVDEAAQKMVLANEVSPFIVVAIANTAKRWDEYTPVAMTLPPDRARSANAERVGGKAQAYADYLIREVKPMIDARYRTLSDAKHTSVGGSSLGGLVSLWLALNRSDVFGAALVVSPSVWWGDDFLVEEVKRAKPATLARARPRLWLDMGTRETTRAIPDVRRLRDTLIERGWTLGDTLGYLEAENASHDEASWAKRVPQMLRFLYAKR
jgi:predicted alpha/beta superfamily hydrolase